MSIETLRRHFDDCKLPVEFIDNNPRDGVRSFWQPARPERPTADNFCFIDVVKRDRNEYFRLYVHPQAELYLRDKRPSTRHLLLQLRCFPQREGVADVRNFVLGHDERQLFVVQTVSAESLVKALESLKPPEVVGAEQRGLKVIRQGDWFFVPTPEFVAEEEKIVKAESIGGTVWRNWSSATGHPHVVDEQIHVVIPSETRAWQMRRPPQVDVFVRGKVRHAEHATVTLRGWHQAFRNRPRNAAPTSLGYYD
jgi:hypothetical protein